MAKRFSRVFFLTLLCCIAAAAAREITREQARYLVKTVLQAKWQYNKLPGFGLEFYTDKYFPDFFFFEATWNNPRGSVVLGHYAVNPRTADVWEIVGCRRLESHSIRNLQQSLRKDIGLSEQQYRKLSARAPCSPPK